MKISGITFIHNGTEHDYCFEESIGSMLGVCDEVVALEASSTDDTLARLKAIADVDPRLKIYPAEWNPAPLNQEAGIDWTKELGEIARTMASHPYIVYLQGDEILHENDYAEIRRCASSMATYFSPRYNFWMDPRHLIPHGRVCGHWIARLAPRECPVLWGSESLDTTDAKPSNVGIYHYGFLRKPEAFRKKAEIMLPAFCGSMDQRVYEVEKEGIKAFRQYWPAEEDLPFKGTHPAAAHQWLTERGYESH